MLRRKIPERTCDKQFENYRKYKDYLQKDFNKRCGYCDITDHIVGGKAVFHIDHFAPKKFKALINTYSNLIYSCPSCNIAKSDDWPMANATTSHDNAQGYIDPCDSKYSQHLTRASCGRIVAQTDLGAYMRKQLKLYLLKHKYLWMADILSEQIFKIKDVLSKSDATNPDVIELKNIYQTLSDKYFTYLQINRS